MVPPYGAIHRLTVSIGGDCASRFACSSATSSTEMVGGAAVGQEAATRVPVLPVLKVGIPADQPVEVHAAGTDEVEQSVGVDVGEVAVADRDVATDPDGER